MARMPNGEEDGWLLRSGVEAHHEFPETFFIPSEAERRGLDIGDFAKLIFEIWLDEPDDPQAASVERMWVFVTEVTPRGYFGQLANNPDALDENDRLWWGVELPFCPEHVIDIRPGTDQSRADAIEPPLRSWPRG
jgi:hypothetical protein